MGNISELKYAIALRRNTYKVMVDCKKQSYRKIDIVSINVA